MTNAALERVLENLSISRHALKRMQQRGITHRQVALTIYYGTTYAAEDALIYVMRRRDVRRYSASPGVMTLLHGIHVICSRDGTVLTCYRGLDYESKLSGGASPYRSGPSRPHSAEARPSRTKTAEAVR